MDLTDAPVGTHRHSGRAERARLVHAVDKTDCQGAGAMAAALQFGCLACVVHRRRKQSRVSSGIIAHVSGAGSPTPTDRVSDFRRWLERGLGSRMKIRRSLIGLSAATSLGLGLVVTRRWSRSEAAHDRGELQEQWHLEVRCSRAQGVEHSLVTSHCHRRRRLSLPSGAPSPPVSEHGAPCPFPCSAKHLCRTTSMQQQKARRRRGRPWRTACAPLEPPGSGGSSQQPSTAAAQQRSGPRPPSCWPTF